MPLLPHPPVDVANPNFVLDIDTTRVVVGKRVLLQSPAEAAAELDGYLSAMQGFEPRIPPLTPGSFDPQVLWTAELRALGEQRRPSTASAAARTLELVPRSQIPLLRWVLENRCELLASLHPAHPQARFPKEPVLLVSPQWSDRFQDHLTGVVVLTFPMQLHVAGGWLPDPSPLSSD